MFEVERGVFDMVSVREKEDPPKVMSEETLVIVSLESS
jgi:hypothetical protein